MCVRACNALVLKLEYLSTTVCQKVHFLPSDAILRILTRASCACPRTLRVSAHISREDTQDGVSVGGFKKAAMSPVQFYIGQWVEAGETKTSRRHTILWRNGLRFAGHAHAIRFKQPGVLSVIYCSVPGYFIFVYDIRSCGPVITVA